MGLQRNEGAVTFSIALLQQRFRELERIREKRKERLLQMLFPCPAARETPVKWFFHPELLYPCRPLRNTLLPAVSSSAASKCNSFQLRHDPLAVELVAAELWPSKAYKHVPSEVDVDTSLHLETSVIQHVVMP